MIYKKELGTALETGRAQLFFSVVSGLVVISLAYSLATASSYLNGQILTLDGGWILFLIFLEIFFHLFKN